MLRGALQIGFVELPVSSASAATVAIMPLLHPDPFDRLLIAEAIAEPAILCAALPLFRSRQTRRSALTSRRNGGAHFWARRSASRSECILPHTAAFASGARRVEAVVVPHRRV
jgi:hypothetical protein